MHILCFWVWTKLTSDNNQCFYILFFFTRSYPWWINNDTSLAETITPTTLHIQLLSCSCEWTDDSHLNILTKMLHFLGLGRRATTSISSFENIIKRGFSFGVISDGVDTKSEAFATNSHSMAHLISELQSHVAKVVALISFCVWFCIFFGIYVVFGVKVWSFC